MMTKIKHLEEVVLDIQANLRELKVLEDYDGADYSELLSDLKWSNQMLRHRLTTLQLRSDVK